MCLPFLAPLGAMMGASAASAAAVGTMTAATMAAGALSAYGTYQQGQTAKAVAQNNQVMAEYAAQDAQRRGEKEVHELRMRAAQLKGTQRATMASRGLDLSEGTPADILDQTDFFAQIDQDTARHNARKDAWRYRAEGTAQRAQGDAAARQANIGAFSTLLTTAGSVASKWGG